MQLFNGCRFGRKGVHAVKLLQRVHETRVSVYVCLCARVRARARASVRACVRVCVCVCVWGGDAFVRGRLRVHATVCL